MTKKAVAFATADWHIRKNDRIWTRGEGARIIGDGSYGIRQVLDMAKVWNIPYIMLAGDILEERIQQSDAAKMLRQAIDELPPTQHFMFVQGQHERAEPPWLNAVSDKPINMHRKEKLLWSGVTVYGLDYLNPANIRAELEQIPVTANVLLTHQKWKDLMGDERGDAWISWVPENIKLIISGDCHVHLEKTVGSRRLISPGPLCMQDLSETSPKGIWVIYDDLSCMSLPLHQRQCFKVEIRTEADLNQFVATARNSAWSTDQGNVPVQIAKNIIRVVYHSDIPEARARIETAVGQFAHLFMSPVNSDFHQLNLEQEQRQAAVIAGGLEGCIDHFYNEPQAVHDDAIRLARTRTLDQDIQAIFQENIRNGINESRAGRS